VNENRPQITRHSGQSLLFDISILLTSLPTSGRPSASEQYRLTRLDTPIFNWLAIHSLLMMVCLLIIEAMAILRTSPLDRVSSAADASPNSFSPAAISRIASLSSWAF